MNNADDAISVSLELLLVDDGPLITKPLSLVLHGEYLVYTVESRR